MPDTDNHIFTIEEVAQIFKCHASTIYRMLRKKQLVGFKIGSDWRFHIKQILEIMNRRDVF